MKLEDILKEIELAWHGVNDPVNLGYFLASPIPWAEVDIRSDGAGRLILRHDSLDTHPLKEGESLMGFEECLDRLLDRGKLLKIDLKEGHVTMERLIRLLKDRGIAEDRLWISTNLKDVAVDDYRVMRRAFPKATLQSTIPHRFMFSMMTLDDRNTWLDLNRDLGVSRLSINWRDVPTAEEVEEVQSAGFEINFYYVESLEAFREAIDLRPQSITSDFHIPSWNLFGRGNGENGFYIERKES